MQSLLSHHFLLPTAQMQDERFFDALIYICRHSKEGAWGFIVNQPSSFMTVGGLLSEMKLDGGADAMKIPAMKGGVVRLEAGFILHTGLPNYDVSFAISENICLTTSRDILPDLAPIPKFSHFLVLMGFCSWRSGQLEQEIHNGDWLACPAAADILFHKDNNKKLELAYQRLGLNPDFFTPTIGSA